MEVIISRNIVKPSSPTPVGFKTHKLSSLDQVGPPVYLPLIFFYEHDESKHQEEISLRLKQSLSEVLTVFYPLAGTLTKQDSVVDCNDRGVEFVEARVHARLAQFIQNPEMEKLKQLVPADSSSYHDNALHLLVKTSHFDCGGIAVAVCFAHKVGDTSCFVRFMNAWAATCRGESSRIIPPRFDMANYFPPRDFSSSASGFHLGITREKIVTKRLVFEREMVEKLKRKAAATSNGDEVKHPSGVEVVSAFIWRSFIEALRASTTSFAAYHMVNLRPRAVPQLPDHTFGNCFTFASAAAVAPSEEDDHDVEYVSKLRGAIRAVNDDYINSDMFFQAVDRIAEMFKPGNCIFTSWRRFPVYDVDFGWGKPVWICTTPMPYANFVVLIDTPSGDGVEAWINVPHQDMFQNFQANYNKLLN